MHLTTRLTLLCSSLALLASGAGPAAASDQAPAAESAKGSLSLPFGHEPEVMLAAHRGQWRDHPENSIPGIRKAVREGTDVVEIDIKQTKDGHLVLMHDDTVDRTTNGSGRVADLTLQEVKSLRLREGQGNGASLTDERVPTFSETLEAVRGSNVLLNLDKGWDHRDALASQLRAKGMVDYGLFKGAPTAAEANDFMAANPELQYMHIINDDNTGDLDDFMTHVPAAIEVAYNSPSDLQGTPAYWGRIQQKTDLWTNSMWDSVSGGHTDEASLRDPDLGWQYFADHGADAIQTDNIRTMHAWREGVDVTSAGLTKGKSTRVQAEDFIDDPAHYSDDATNDCGTRAIRNPESPVDACDLDGAHIVQYVREGERFTLEVEVTKPGSHALTLRHSSDTEPGGTVTVDTGKGPGAPVALPNQTHNRAFTVTDLGRYRLSKGTHRVQLEFSHPDYLSVDWLQLDQSRFRDGGVLR